MKLRTRALGVCLLATLAAAAAIGSGTAAVAAKTHVSTAGARTLLAAEGVDIDRKSVV